MGVVLEQTFYCLTKNIYPTTYNRKTFIKQKAQNEKPESIAKKAFRLAKLWPKNVIPYWQEIDDEVSGDERVRRCENSAEDGDDDDNYELAPQVRLH